MPELRSSVAFCELADTDWRLPKRILSTLGHESRPSLQVSRLRLIEGHRFIHANFSPEQEFHFVFRERTERAIVRLEPDVLRCVRASHPVRKPMIEFTGGFPRARRITISREDRVLFRSGHVARSLSVRYTCERCVHCAGGQLWDRERCRSRWTCRCRSSGSVVLRRWFLPAGMSRRSAPSSATL